MALILFLLMTHNELFHLHRLMKTIASFTECLIARSIGYEDLPHSAWRSGIILGVAQELLWGLSCMMWSRIGCHGQRNLFGRKHMNTFTHFSGLIKDALDRVLY
jgi:hypothetical protein